MTLPAFRAASSPVSSPPLQVVTPPRGYSYLVSQPAGAAPKSGWPLLLFLHGAGERGTVIADITRQGLPKLLSGHPDLTTAERTVAADVAARFLVVAPQCPPHEVWDDALVLALLERVGGERTIDPARVYFTGLSMGGFGVWSLGLRQPERFAALAPICGGGRISDVEAAARTRPAALRTLGAWAFHGARDRVVPPDESERMVAALRRADMTDVRLTVYPDLEHDSWTPTYANPELYAWLLAHRR